MPTGESFHRGQHVSQAGRKLRKVRPVSRPHGIGANRTPTSHAPSPSRPTSSGAQHGSGQHGAAAARAGRPNLGSRSTASIAKTQGYKTKVRQTRLPGESYRSASAYVKASQGNTKAANALQRIQDRREAESHDSGGFLHDVGHAAASAVSEVGKQASKAPIVRASTAALGIEAKVGKAALDVLNKKVVTLPKQVPGASRTKEGARDITVGDIASLPLPIAKGASVAAKVAPKLAKLTRVEESATKAAAAAGRAARSERVAGRTEAAAAGRYKGPQEAAERAKAPKKPSKAPQKPSKPSEPVLGGAEPKKPAKPSKPEPVAQKPAPVRPSRAAAKQHQPTVEDAVTQGNKAAIERATAARAKPAPATGGGGRKVEINLPKDAEAFARPKVEPAPYRGPAGAKVKRVRIQAPERKPHGPAKPVTEPKSRAPEPAKAEPVPHEQVKANTLASITKRPRVAAPHETQALKALEAEGRVYKSETSGKYFPGKNPRKPEVQAAKPRTAQEIEDAKAQRRADKRPRVRADEGRPLPQEGVEAVLKRKAKERAAAEGKTIQDKPFTHPEAEPVQPTTKVEVPARQQPIKKPLQTSNEARRARQKASAEQAAKDLKEKAAKASNESADAPLPAKNYRTTFERGGDKELPAVGEDVNIKVHTKRYTGEVVKVNKKTLKIQYVDKNGAVKTTSRPIKDYTKGHISKVLRAPGENKSATLFGSAGALGVTGAAREKDPSKVQAPFVGTARALNPVDGSLEDTLGTTIRTAPALLTAPIGMAANVGISGARALSTAGALADIPGFHEYTTEQITAPTEKVGTETFAFAKGMFDTYASGDAHRIEEATKHDYGLTPLIMVGIPGAKLLGKAGVTDRIGAGVRKIDKFNDALDRRTVRKEQSVDAGYYDTFGKHGASNAAKGFIKHSRRVDDITARKAKLNKNGVRVNSRDTYKVVAEEGIKTIAQAKKVRARLPERPNVSYKTAHDALDYLIENPDLLKRDTHDGKHYGRALDAYKTQAKENEPGLGVGTYRAKYGKQAITYNVKLPEDRFLKERAQLEKDLHDEVITRKDYDRELRILDKKAEDQFVGVMKAKAKQHDLAEPSYAGDFVDRGLPSGVPFPKGAKKQHMSKFYYSEKGLADHSFEQLIAKGIRDPRIVRADNMARDKFAETEAQTFAVPGPHGKRRMKLFTSDEIRKLDIDKKKYVVWDRQQFGQAVTDPSITHELDYTDVASLRRDLEKRDAEAAAGLDISKGKKYIIVPKEAAKEWSAQRTPETSSAQKAIHHSQRAASRMVLGYSPSWLLAQPVAESAQALAAVTNPLHHVRGRKAIKDLAELDRQAGIPEGTTRHKFGANFGGTSGTADVREFVGTLQHDTPELAKEYNRFANNPTLRAMRSLFTARGASALDRYKGAKIREQLAAAKVAKDLHGGIKNMVNFSKKYDRKATAERVREIANDRHEGAKLESYVDDVMGNWRALTRHERDLSSYVVFYPFVRMSLKWAFHTFPKHHPAKAVILNFLAQNQAEAVEQMYGGKPGFFNQFGNAPLYTGLGTDETREVKSPAIQAQLERLQKTRPELFKQLVGGDATYANGVLTYHNEVGAPTSMLPLSRVAPGSNAFIEAVGGTSDPVVGALRSLNPVIGAVVNAIYGTDPLTGKALAEKGTSLSPAHKASNALVNLSALPAPIRVAMGLSGAADKLKGRADTPSGNLMDILTHSKDVKRVLAQSINPFTIQNTARQRQLAEIGRLQARKYKVPHTADYFYNTIVPAANAATKGGKSPIGTKAEKLVVDYLDSIVAANQLRHIEAQYGIKPEPSLTGRAKDLSQAMQPGALGPDYHEAMKDALGKRENSYPTGLKQRRLQRLRKAQARRVMGNS